MEGTAYPLTRQRTPSFEPDQAFRQTKKAPVKGAFCCLSGDAGVWGRAKRLPPKAGAGVRQHPCLHSPSLWEGVRGTRRACVSCGQIQRIPHSFHNQKGTFHLGKSLLCIIPPPRSQPTGCPCTRSDPRIHRGHTPSGRCPCRGRSDNSSPHHSRPAPDSARCASR